MGVRSLVLVNVGSVSDYQIGVALLRCGRIRAAFGIGVVEVTVHAVAASIVLGWASGFHVYIPILAGLARVHQPIPPCPGRSLVGASALLAKPAGGKRFVRAVARYCP